MAQTAKMIFIPTNSDIHKTCVMLSIPDAMVSVPRLHRGCWEFESLGIDQLHFWLCVLECDVQGLCAQVPAAKVAERCDAVVQAVEKQAAAAGETLALQTLPFKT